MLSDHGKFNRTIRIFLCKLFKFVHLFSFFLAINYGLYIIENLLLRTKLVFISTNLFYVVAFSTSLFAYTKEVKYYILFI